MGTLPEAYRPLAVSPGEPKLWRPPLYFGASLAAVLLTSTHEVCVRQALAFGQGDSRLPGAAGLAVGLLGLTAGVAASSRWCRRPEAWLAPLLLFSSCAVMLSSSVLFVSFGGQEQRAWRLVVPGVCGLSLGASAKLAHGALGSLWHRLALFNELLSPLRLFALLSLFVSVVGAAPLLGLLRSAYLAGVLMCSLALWYGSVHRFVESKPLPSFRLIQNGSIALCLLGAALFVSSERWLSREQLGYFQNPVVFAHHTERSEIVVTTGPAGWQLFVNRSLRAADLDSHRYFEALVRPAFALRPTARRILILGIGDGYVEREVLRHSAVERVDVVSEDLGVARLVRKARWLEERTERSLSSPKLNFIEAEPLVWLDGRSSEYEIVLVDLNDPVAPRWGKNFTRHFYRQLAAQLAPGGVLAVQAGDVFETAHAFANVVATIRSAGLLPVPYRAAIPSIGDWGFVLASEAELALPGKLAGSARFLTDRALPSLFSIPRDSLAPGGAPSTLFDQRIVELWHQR